MNNIEPRLAYNYAKIIVDTGLCTTVRTTSYEINMAGFIRVPVYTEDYEGKYYNASDGLWYLDGSFETLWVDAPQW